MKIKKTQSEVVSNEEVTGKVAPQFGQDKAPSTRKYEEDPTQTPGYKEDRDYSYNRDKKSSPKPPDHDSEDMNHQQKDKSEYPDYFSPSQRYEELVSDESQETSSDNQDRNSSQNKGTDYSPQQNQGYGNQWSGRPNEKDPEKKNNSQK